MLLNEVFKVAADWNWANHGLVVADFEISDVEYEVKAFDVSNLSPDDFRLYFRTIPSPELYKWLSSHTTHMMTFTGDGSYEITHSGNQYQVFATILDIIPAYMSRTHCDILLFTAVEPSRQKLYNRMVSAIQVPGLVGMRLSNSVYAIATKRAAKILVNNR